MGETVHKNKAEGARKTNKPLVLASVMLAMFMGAIEATIVSTAMPAIVADLGGFKLYSWIFSAYLLMNSVTVLIYGKLSDLFGRKPILFFGIILFLIGSILCGFANSMKTLIIYRLIQGFGAGAVMPIATTIVGDIYTIEERAKIQGYLSSVWGISAIVGPAIGGFLVQYSSWHYVFWMNIPLGILSILGLMFFLQENVEKKSHKIDYPGAFLLTIAISSLMYVLVESGDQRSFSSPMTLWLIGLFIISIILFIFQEMRATEPMMPFNIWKERSIFVANIASLTSGIILIGITTFLPTFVQGVMEQSAIVAGFTLTSMSIGWPIASTMAGKMLITIGYRTTSIIGGISLILGSIAFITMSNESGPIWAAAGSFFVGVGMGLTSTAFIVSIQSTVSWQQRGIATAANMFMRNLGNTIGAAMLGGILNSQLKAYFSDSENRTGVKLTVESTNTLLKESERSNLPLKMIHILQDGLTVSIHKVYFVVTIFAVVTLIFILFMPKKNQEV